MRYEWNEEKSRSNRKKHGVAFEAVKVFNDPFLLLTKDRIEEGEQRWHAIGRRGGDLIGCSRLPHGD